MITKKKMDNSSNCEQCEFISSKKRYIQQWLEYSSYFTEEIDIKFNEKSYLCFTKDNENNEGLPKQWTSCPYRISPVLGKKRLGSSKIQVNKKITKKIKIANTFDTRNDTICNNMMKMTAENLIDQEKINQYHLQLSHVKTDFNKLRNPDNKIKSDKKITFLNTRKNTNIKTQNSTYKNISNYISPKLSNTEASSQCIESVSSHTESTEISLQDIDSSSDKTKSDLIEEISSELVLETILHQDSIACSTSNTSSISIKPVKNLMSGKSDLIKKSKSPERIQRLFFSNQINSIDKIDAKVDFNKSNYILKNLLEKKKKRKSNTKGILLSTLYQIMGKERSNINLLRHQLVKKPFNIIMKPFLLLQIIEYLPTINENQLLMCILAEDKMNLLKNVFKKQTHRFIIVMNVPQISGLLNINHKPILKIYEPWLILDHYPLLIQITRFIAISSSMETIITDKSMFSKRIKITQELYCPCTTKKMLSNKCKSKFEENRYNVIKTIFHYK